MIRLWAIFLALMISTPAWPATYYVATTGNDSTGDGSISTPWRNLQKCALPPVAEGDTCIVRSGTYSTAGSILMLASSAQGSASGNSLNPITIKSEVPLGAVLKQPTGSSSASIFYLARPWYIIEGFDMDGTGVTYNTGSTASHAAVNVRANNITIRRNSIHDIARTQCSNSDFGNAAFLIVDNITGTVIDKNSIYKIGRLRNGESGCATTHFQHDHGIYSAGADNTTITRNLMYDINRGYPIHIFSSGKTHSNILIEHNTISGKNASGTPASNAPFGQIILCNTVNAITIRNNIFHNPPLGYPINWCGGTVATNVSVTSNDMDVTEGDATKDFQNPSSKPASGVSASNNRENQTLGLASTTLGSENLTLLPTSESINAGLNTGQPFCGSAPDKGAFEVCGPVAASITASLLDVTYGSAFGPIQVGGATGHSVGCTTDCGTLTVSNASLFSSADSIVRYTLSGFSAGNCVDTQTITKSFNAATGTLTDSINIGGTLNQPVHSYGPIAVTNQCTGGGSPTPPGSPHRLYELDGDGDDTSGNTGHATVSGGSFVAGKYGQALQGTDGTAVSATSDYGSGVNPSTQDLTIIFGYEVPAGATSLTRTFAGSSLGTDQRLHISAQSGTWQIAIGDSSTSAGTPSNLPVVEGWNRVCLRLDSTADVATLTVNNVTGTGGATKAIPDYTLASNIAFGLPSGFNTVVAGGGKWDKAVIYTSLVSCNDDWLAWEPTASPPVGTYAQTGARWYRVMDDGAAGAVLYSTASTVNVVQRGAIIYQSRTACSGANCSAIGEKLWYTHNGGTAQEVPNSFTSDGVAFWGVNTSASMFLGAASWSPSLDGTTQTTNVAKPSIELEEDASIVRNSVLRFADDATGTFCFHERDQNGNELDSVPTACVVVIPPQASGGF